MRRHRAIPHSRYDLAERLGSYVAYRENSLYVGLGVFPCKDISVFILADLRKKLCRRFSANAYEKTVHLKLLLLAACKVFKNYSSTVLYNMIRSIARWHTAQNCVATLSRIRHITAGRYIPLVI